MVSVAPDSDATDVAEAIGHVAEHRHEWASIAPDVRADVLSRAASILESTRDTLVEELVREEGKTRAEAMMEVRRTPQNLRYYASEALRTTGETFPTGDGSLVFTRASRSAWSPRSRRGTSRSTSPPASSGPRSPPATG